jgi:hypothetical protein
MRDVVSNKQPVEKMQFLSYPAQCALLYHLQRESLEDKTFQVIAKTLGYSAMTVTRIAKELIAFELAKVAGGKENIFHLIKRGNIYGIKDCPFFQRL